MAVAAAIPLATMAVSFVTTGVSAVVGAIGTVGTLLASVVSAAGSVGNALATVGTAAAKAAVAVVQAALALPAQMLQALNSAVQTAIGLLTTLAGFLARARAAARGFLDQIKQGAMESTVEAERLARAWERLYRVLGDQIAPSVRMLTGLLHQLADAWLALDADTRANITRIALWGTAIAGAVASALALAPAVGSVLTGAFAALQAGLTFLLSPLGLLSAGFVLLAGHLGGAAEKGIDWRERMVRAIQGVLDAWDRLRAGVNAAMTFAEAAITGLWPIIKDTGRFIVELADFVVDVWTKITPIVINVVRIIGAAVAVTFGVVAKWIQTLYDGLALIMQRAAETAKVLKEMGVLDVQIPELPPFPKFPELPDFPDLPDFEKIPGEMREAWRRGVEEWEKGIAAGRGKNREIAEGIGGAVDEAVEEARRVGGELAVEVGKILGLFPRGAGRGFTILHEVRWETGTAIWERMQSAMVELSHQDVEREQLVRLEEIVEIGERIVGRIADVAGKLGFEVQ